MSGFITELDLSNYTVKKEHIINNVYFLKVIISSGGYTQQFYIGIEKSNGEKIFLSSQYTDASVTYLRKERLLFFEVRSGWVGYLLNLDGSLFYENPVIYDARELSNKNEKNDYLLYFPTNLYMLHEADGKIVTCNKKGEKIWETEGYRVTLLSKKNRTIFIRDSYDDERRIINLETHENLINEDVVAKIEKFYQIDDFGEEYVLITGERLRKALINLNTRKMVAVGDLLEFNGEFGTFQEYDNPDYPRYVIDINGNYLEKLPYGITRKISPNLYLKATGYRQYCVVDRDGNKVAGPYENVWKCKNFIVVNYSQYYGTLDIDNGDVILDCRYSEISEDIFKEDIPIIRDEKSYKYGIMNEGGDLEILCKYSELRQPDESGYIYFNDDNVVGFLDKDYKVVFEVKGYSSLRRHYRDSGIACLKNGRWGFLDEKGVCIVPPVYAEIIRYFIDGKAIVKTTDFNYLVIDMQGNVLQKETEEYNREMYPYD